MKARALYEAGQLDEAIEALGAELRSDPTDTRRRTFLFELLCFAGEYDRAEKQLDVLARHSRDADMGAWLYRAALHAERTRQAMFEGDDLGPAPGPAVPVAGTLNGEPFGSIEDADPRIGARLEIFAAGQYTWLPLEHIAAIRIEAPKRLRDLVWASAHVQTGPGFKGEELGEILIPVLGPQSWRAEDPELRLGRATDWRELDDGTAVPVGHKLLLVDGEPVPILDVRTLEIHAATHQPG